MSTTSSLSSSTCMSSRKFLLPLATYEDDAEVSAYLDASMEIINQTVYNYWTFVKRGKRRIDTRQWNYVASQSEVKLYEEDMDYMVRGAQYIEPDRGRVSSLQREFQCVSSVMGNGSLQGTLDLVMGGLYADNKLDMKKISAIQHKRFVDCDVIQVIARQSEQNSFNFLGIKWLSTHVKDDLSATEEVCWLERMGMYTSNTGETFGFQLLKTVEMSEETGPDLNNVPISFSLCYLYRQIEKDTVEVFFRGIVEYPISKVQMVAANDFALEFALAITKARQCHQMKRISELIRLSKKHRETTIACRCSKVVKGLPRMEMCSTCRANGKENKLISVRELTKKTTSTTKQQQYNRRRIPNDFLTSSNSMTSTSSRRRGGGHNTFFLSSMQNDIPSRMMMHEQDTYEVGHSLRMFLPIRDRKSSSSRCKQDNVLIHMLHHHEKLKRAKAADQLILSR